MIFGWLDKSGATDPAVRLGQAVGDVVALGVVLMMFWVIAQAVIERARANSSPDFWRPRETLALLPAPDQGDDRSTA
jgi:hypothetical protein